MKRFIVVSLLLLAVLAVALPGAVGFVAEQQHDRLVEQISTHGGQLTEEQYERGWFKTTTRHRYRIEDLQLRKLAVQITGEPDGIPELLVYSEIAHGPLPIVSAGPGHSILAWTDVDSTLYLRSPSGVETRLPGDLRSRIDADGSSRYRYRAAAESTALPNGLTLSWSDSDIDVLVGRRGDSVSVDGKIGLVTLADADAELKLGSATVYARQQLGQSGLWTGDMDIRIDDLSVPGFAAGQFLLITKVLESAGQASYAVDLKANDLQLEGFSGNSAHIDFLAQRVDGPALAALLQLFHDRSQIPPAQRNALIKKLIAAGPEISLHTLKIPAADGYIEGEGLVTIKPGTGNGPGELSRGAAGNVLLLAPKKMVAAMTARATPETRGAIELMMGLGVLKADGNRYRIEAAYGGGLLTVNGFPVPIPAF